MGTCSTKQIRLKDKATDENADNDGENSKQKESKELTESLLEFKRWYDENKNTVFANDGMLIKGIECAFCFGIIGNINNVWTCSCCKNIVHYKCMKMWRDRDKNKKNIENKTCATCRTEHNVIKRTCYCSKEINPKMKKQAFPFSCNQVCGISLSKNCDHKCEEVCHPGQCKPCGSILKCYCGRNELRVDCKSLAKPNIRSCKTICEKELSCGKHVCIRECHAGDCFPCLPFTTGLADVMYPNGHTICAEMPIENTRCRKRLSCGNHFCKRIEHEDSCEPCFDGFIICECGRSRQDIDCIDKPQTTFKCKKECGNPLNCGHNCMNHCSHDICICSTVLTKECPKCLSPIYHLCGDPSICFERCNKA